jgi:Flp pilus assembly protein TadG
MALVVLLLVTLIFGMIDFGRVLMIANMVTHATRDGARMASVMDRCDSTGNLGPTNLANVETAITTLLGDVGVDDAMIEVNSGVAVGGMETVQVITSVEVNYQFLSFFVPLIGDSLSIVRTVTFREEGAVSPDACG